MPDTPTGLPLRSATDLISPFWLLATTRDRKSTRLNSSHDQISYAVFCLKKKNTRHSQPRERGATSAACISAQQLRPKAGRSTLEGSSPATASQRHLLVSTKTP